jgi:Na+/H+-dicarboxylate symporter
LRLKVHTQILIAIVLGTVAGLALGEKAIHLKVVGDMFIRLLKMIIIPLILASMVAGIVSLGDVRRLGRIGLKTFIYYTATTLLAVSVGLVLVNLMKPGVGVKMGTEAAVDMASRETPSIVSIIEDIIPENLFAAMAENKVLSVIFFSLLLGIAISSTGEKAKPLAAFFESFNTVMMKITDWIMLLAPFGVFALMAYTIGTMGFSVLRPLAVYMVTVVLGLSIHAFVTLADYYGVPEGEYGCVK